MLFSIMIAYFLQSCTSNEIYKDVEAVSETVVSTAFHRDGFAINLEDGAVAIDLALLGDTLFVNTELMKDDRTIRTVKLYSIASKSKIAELGTWQEGGKTVSFTDKLTDVYADTTYIIVSQLNSKIDIFDSKTLKHLKTIGTGNWWGNDNYIMVHSFGVTVWKHFLVTRDITQLRIYDLRTLSANPNKQVPFYTKSNPLARNNAYKPITLTCKGDTLWCGDFSRKRIDVFNMKTMTSASEIEKVGTLNLSVSPLSIDYVENNLWITAFDKILRKMNRAGHLQSQYDLSVQNGVISGSYFYGIDSKSQNVVRWKIEKGTYVKY